jgi:hypothetical protein
MRDTELAAATAQAVYRTLRNEGKSVGFSLLVAFLAGLKTREAKRG